MLLNYHIGRFVLQPATRTLLKPIRTQISNTQRTKSNTTDVVIEQHSRKLLMMEIFVFETCSEHKKWRNKISSDIKLVFYSTTNKAVNLYVATRFLTLTHRQAKTSSGYFFMQLSWKTVVDGIIKL